MTVSLVYHGRVSGMSEVNAHESIASVPMAPTRASILVGQFWTSGSSTFADMDIDPELLRKRATISECAQSLSMPSAA